MNVGSSINDSTSGRRTSPGSKKMLRKRLIRAMVVDGFSTRPERPPVIRWCIAASCRRTIPAPKPSSTGPST